VSQTGGEPGAAARAGRLRRRVRITNRLGLHARAAARFVQVAAGFEAELWVSREETEVSGRSILGLMMLAAGPGHVLVLEAAGRDAVAALDALCGLVERGFDEE
jgi:phosphocarrier protein